MTNLHNGQCKSGPHLLEASTHSAARLRLPDAPSKGLDALGFDQGKLNKNFMTWMDQLSDQDKHEGNQWYPTGNDWGNHAAELYEQHPDKVFGAMSKTSPQRDWYANLGDTENIVSNHRHSPEEIVTPGGISGRNNLRQALRVMDAPDDPEAIHAAFLGTKNMKRKGRTVAVPRTPDDLPKTYDFMRTLRNPEEGGEYNYAQQPGVVDSWMGRTMLWPKDVWDEAQQKGGRPLTWPGQGTGEGLDKHMPVKKPNPQTGKWEVVGTKPPSARDVAARVTSMAGGYNRMRNAMRYGAAAHDMPFTHGAQAAAWKAISGNENPSGVPDPDVDPFYIEHPGERWNEMWNRRASGLHVPAHSGFQVARVAAHGSKEVEDSLDEGWGTPKDFADILRHVSMIPEGWDAWENRPKFIALDPHHQAAIDKKWYTPAAQITHATPRRTIQPKGNPYKTPSKLYPVKKANIHSGQLKSGPWLLEASSHESSRWFVSESQADFHNDPLIGITEDEKRRLDEQQTAGDITASRWFITADSDDAVNSLLSGENPDKLKGPQAQISGIPQAGGDMWAGDPHASPMGRFVPTMYRVQPGGGGGGYSGGGVSPIAPLDTGGYSTGGGSSSSSSDNAAPGVGGAAGTAPVPYDSSGGPSQWHQQVLRGLENNGLPASLAPQVEHQIQTESSGNPNAINNWDSNAQAGHPSQGLLQTIPSTFNTYHHPGDSMSITDPQANIDSALGYAKATYGPTLMNNGNGLGSGHGY